MAINYTRIDNNTGWTTNTYVNPTHMNHMEDGIKAACDGVDAIGTNYTKLTSTTMQTVERSAGGGEAALALKSNTTVSALRLLDASGTFLGDIGVNASQKPYFDDGTKKEIALQTPQSIAANTNLNDLKALGWYACPSGAVAATLINSPYTTNEFGLWVTPSNAGGGRFQTLYAHASTATAMYVRRFYNNAWTAWQQIALKEVVTGTVTNAITPTRADIFNVIKSGNVAQVCINNVAYSQSMSSDTKIATLSIKPKLLTRFLIYRGADNSPLRGMLDTSGQLFITDYTSGNLLYGSFTYLTED